MKNNKRYWLKEYKMKMNTEIKLIATDVGGTLVKDSSPQMYDEMIDIILKLSDQGIRFVIASG